jgi:GNAT superfamily N-acetyltransferase
LISVDGSTVELNDLFVELRCIGKGCGTQLWDYAVKLARSLWFRRIVLTTDPNAEPFYVPQGAVRVGEKASPVRSDRVLPIMEYILNV